MSLPEQLFGKDGHLLSEYQEKYFKELVDRTDKLIFDLIVTTKEALLLFRSFSTETEGREA